MADKLPEYPALLVADRPLAEPVFVRDESIPPADAPERSRPYFAALRELAARAAGGRVENHEDTAGAGPVRRRRGHQKSRPRGCASLS